MRHLTLVVPACLLGLLTHAVLPNPTSSARSTPDDTALRGQYVEARTASVFAGACHYGSEYTTRGREALLAWHFEAGSWQGVDLSGVNVVLAVAGEQNLDEAEGARHSLVYTDLESSPERRAASAAFVRERCRALAGDVREVKCVDLKVALAGESYSVEAPGMFEIRGSKLENRACCSMPYDVWYAPFVDVAHPVVGCNEIFRFEDRALGPVWKRSSQNESFVGSFDLSYRVPAQPSRSPVLSNLVARDMPLTGMSSRQEDRR